MPICIAGMPFSGTCLVARVLHPLGLDLGPAEERFGSLNEEILAALGAAWDSPPADEGSWEQYPQLEPLRQRAAVVSRGLALAEPWGWADPRNSLTLPFWRVLFPELRVLVCLRDPHEVASLLEARGLGSYASGLRLWRSYYQPTLDLAEDHRVVTHYARFTEAPREEIERLAAAVGLRASGSQIRRAAASLNGRTTIERPSEDPALPPGVRELYRTLLQGAASHGQAKARKSSVAIAEQETAADLLEANAVQRLELEHLRLELARRQGHTEALQTQLDARAAGDVDLTQIIHDLEEQLMNRDEEIAALRAHRLHAEDSLRRAIDALEKKLSAVEPTLLWRLGQRYWSLKQLIRQSLRRGAAS
jgi:hypothetical protein